MKAMILAAGIGSRLKPVTDHIPKALVPIEGQPILGIIVKKMKLFGITDIVINLHHFPQQIIDYIVSNDSFGVSIRFSDESDMLLDTGGGIKNALEMLRGDEPVLIQNVDILSDLDFNLMKMYHQGASSLATLAVSDRKTSRYLLFDEANQLCGWENVKTGEVKKMRDNSEEEKKTNRLAFSGIQILQPEIFNYFPDKKVFSVIDFYLSLAGKEKIFGYRHNSEKWTDVGRNMLSLNSARIEI